MMNPGFFRGMKITTLLAVFLLGVWGVDRAEAFPINGVNARTLFAFTAIVPRYRLTLADTDPAFDPKRQEVREEVFSLTGVYGFTRDFTLAGILPYFIQKEVEFTPAGGGRKKIETSGIGDASVIATYRLFRKDTELGSRQFSLLFGIELPTGSDSETNTNVPLLTGGTSNRIPAGLQPGSGSVDFLLGAGAFMTEGRFSLYGSLVYKANTEANDFRFGNSLNYDLVADYLIYAKEPNLFFVLELNGVYAERNEEGGIRQKDSGGNTIFISPGFQLLPRPDLILEASVQVPVLQELHGVQPEKDFSVVFGFRYLF